MEVLSVDPHDDALLKAWYEAYHAGSAAGRAEPAVWTLPELVVPLRQPDPAQRTLAYAAIDAGQAVGGVLAELPLLDNLRLVMFELVVAPGARRRGVGSALHERVVELARAEGRDSLLSEVVEPLSGGPSADVRFAEQRGYTRRTRDIHRVLTLPIDQSRLGDLARLAAERQGGYRLRTWRGPCPDDVLDGYVALRGRFMTEVPLGDLDYEPERWDERRLRAEESRVAAQARTAYTTVAVGPTGELVGHTVLLVPGHDPGAVFQGDTLVLPEHRGHRLGLAMKVANLQTMQRAHPEPRLLHTWNAEDNDPMVAVNEAMGFRPLERISEFQRDL